ncbi:unnamed protein product [Alternaria alternata]
MTHTPSLADSVQLSERNRARTLSPINASADFILSSVSLAENTRYVAEFDRFVSLEEAEQHENALIELWRDTAEEKQKLLMAMDVLQQKTRRKDSVTEKTHEEQRSYTWKQVITEVQTASDSYKKTIFARMCDKSDIFEHWLALLPAGDYTSSISGAFILGVQAARNVSGTQQAIYEALASIPEALSHASAYVEIYKAHSSDALVKKTAELCKNILVVLRVIVEFFAKSSWRRGASAMMKGSAHQQELTEAIEEMKTKALQLRRRRTSVCNGGSPRWTHMLTDRLERFRHELSKEELLLAIDSSTEITAQKVCTYLMRHLQSNPEFNLSHTPGATPLLGVGDASPQRPSTGTGTGNSITVKTLLRTLDVDLEAVQDDIEYCLALGFTQNEDFQKRASLVLHSSEFGNFVAAANQSKFLLVNGNNDAAQFISPLSHVCAKTIDLLSVSDDIICLTYFCSRHTDQWREPRADATGLVASLTAQLLTQIKKRRKIDGFSLDLSFLSFDDHCAVQEEDMDATFNVFQAIVKQLAKDTVIFCFIDGLSAYENFDRRQDTSRLMQSILKLVKRSKGVVFRCMVTFPGRGSFTDTWDMRSVGRKAETLEVLVGGL